MSFTLCSSLLGGLMFDCEWDDYRTEL